MGEFFNQTKKWLQSIVEVLCFLPIYVILASLILPVDKVWLWIIFLPVNYLIGILLASFVPHKRTFLRFAGMIVFGVALNYLLIGFEWLYLILWAINVYLVLRGILFEEYKWSNIFPKTILWVGYGIYFVSLFLFNRIESMQPYFTPCLWLGVAYVIITLFVTNMETLKSATLSGKDKEVVSESQKIFNWSLIAILTFIILIISFFNKLKDAVWWFFSQIGIMLWKAYMFLIGLMSPGGSGGSDGGGGQADMLAGLADETERTVIPWVEKMIEIFAITILVIGALAFIFFGGRALLRVIIKLYKKFMEMIKGGGEAVFTGSYTDEKESMADLKEIGQIYRKRISEWWKDRMDREAKWSDLKDNRERVRWLYRSFFYRKFKQGYEFKEYLTPEEVINDAKGTFDGDNLGELAEAYREARYSPHQPDDEKVEKLFKDFKN